MKLIIAIFSFIIYIIPTVIVDLFIKLIGLPMVAFGLLFKKETYPPEWNYPSNRVTYDGWRFVALPEPLQSIWGNDKYGAMGNFITARERDPESFWAQYEWLALRNPASNYGHLPHMLYVSNSDNIVYYGANNIDDNKGITGIRFTYDKTSPWRCGLVILKRYGDSERGLWMRLGFLQYSDGGEHVSALKGMLLPHPFKYIPKG